MNPVVPAPPDLTLISETLRTRLPFSATLTKLIPLPGDASNRRYFRLQLKGGPPRSLILMQLAGPEAFKQSEEAVSGATPPVAELPFVNVLNHLAKADIAVPVLHYFDQSAGLLYLKDFGDLTLAEACRHASNTEIASRYRQAIDTLVQIHTRATTPNPACIAFGRRFDVPLLMWEFDHFLEYGVVARNGQPMRPADEQAVRSEFQKIAESLAALPRVFTHRDYHSRNLMVDGSRLGVIDFQDALMGPAVYDLASLLRDAYIALDESLIDNLLAYYLDQMRGRGIECSDREAFRRQFDLMSVQRNLKAAGRFVYIDRVKHNPKFLTDIPRVLGYVRLNLAKYSELTYLKKHLTPYIPELADSL
ncbi:MAG TPA: phosphotransferase [Nitrospiraceae bacterium]|nr:phosphotransferase [Nitrospiraceae bacterium]